MPGSICHFHTDSFCMGVHQGAGVYAFECPERDHTQPGPWRWLEAPPPPPTPGVSGLADELGMQQTLPAVVASLGQGWFEYGLVEEAFARQHPSDFAQLVDRWGHTAIESRTYTASSYLARVLGDLSRLGSVAYHPGKGTGRWSYDVLVSYWSALPAPAWKQRTSWLDVHGASQTAADDPCRSYVPGS